MTLRTMLAATALAFGATSATADPVLYECDVKDKRHGLTWVADKIAIVANDDGSVVVIDPVILQYNDNKPMQARVSTRTTSKLKLRWKIANARDSKNVLARFNYSAILNLKTLKIVVYADPVSFPQRFSGRGTCKIHTNANALKSLRLR